MAARPDELARPWPLIGRDDDLDRLCGAIAADCRTYVVLGEAGSGKSRLAGAALERLAAAGWRTAAVTATESARNTPLGALASIVPAEAHGSPATVFQATRAAIGPGADERPLVLLVDDAHHLDPPSADLLVSLADAGALRLVLTMRSGQRGPAGVVALRAGHDTAVEAIGGLGPVAVTDLLQQVLGGPLDGLAASLLLATTAGNPLYLREVVVAAVADGTLQDVAGVWRLTGSPAVGAALGDLVLGRLTTLTSAERDALELIAVGEPIDLDLLETLADSVVLERLEAGGLIRVDLDHQPAEVRLVHPVYGETLRASIGRGRIRTLSATLADAIAAQGGLEGEATVRLARFQIDAGRPPDVAVVMGGARMARHHQDWVATAALARAALDAGHLDAAALLVEAHFALGEFDEGDAITGTALRRADAMSEAALVELHRTRADSLFFAHDDAAGAVEYLAQVAETVEDPARRDLLLFSRGAMLVWSGRVTEAVALVEPLLASPDARVAVQAAMVLETAAANCGPATRAIALADEWFPVHLRLPDLGSTNNPGNHLLIKAVALANAGRLAEAEALATLGYEGSVAVHSLAGQLWFALERGRIALLRGDLVGAPRWFREQVALCRSTGWRRPITLGLSGLAVAEAYLGHAEAAAAAIRDRDETGLSTIELFSCEGARGEAWALAAGGQHVRARAVLIAGAVAAEAAGIVLMAGLARFDALRLGDGDQARPLAAAAAVSESAILDLAARWAARPDDGDELWAVAEGFHGLGCAMFAAEAFDACAAAWRHDGETRRAVGAEHRADALVRRSSRAALPGIDPAEAVVPLTAREHEVARLVADGATSKEVAEQLFLSARTVSNHLQNAYSKLGIGRRSELGDALGRYGREPETMSRP